jgi:hypothetical protein
MFVGLFGV